MKQEIINGGNARYLGELERFKDGIPFGIVNKTKTDVGGTYVAANCSSNYIIVCPFKDLVDSIAADKNNRYEIFKCYGGVREYQFRKYIKNNTTYKIAVTYDSLPKLIGWLSSTEGWKVLVERLFSLLFRPKVYWLSCCTFSSSVILLTRSFTRSSMGALASL